MELDDIRKELNFRELGGIALKNGRTVRHGIFYRSAAPGDLNAEELDFFRKLGIRSIFDFRSDFERELLPDPVPEGAAHYALSALVDTSGKAIDLSPAAIEESTKKSEQSDEALGFLDRMYAGLPFADAYRTMFREIEAGQVPLLIHCTAGKDRTGVAAILILLALGCDEETALDDYMKTNEYRKELIERFLEERKDILETHPEYTDMLVGYNGVVRASAEHSLKSILRRYDSFDEYFERQFGLDETRRRRLITIYTE